MNIGYQIAVSGAAIVALIAGYCYVADVSEVELPDDWLGGLLGLVLLVAGAAVPLGVLVGVWL